jgi:hypothetical protein
MALGDIHRHLVARPVARWHLFTTAGHTGSDPSRTPPSSRPFARASTATRAQSPGDLDRAARPGHSGRLDHRGGGLGAQSPTKGCDLEREIPRHGGVCRSEWGDGATGRVPVGDRDRVQALRCDRRRQQRNCERLSRQQPASAAPLEAGLCGSASPAQRRRVPFLGCRPPCTRQESARQSANELQTASSKSPTPGGSPLRRSSRRHRPP